MRADARYFWSTGDHRDLGRPDNMSHWRLSVGFTYLWSMAPYSSRARIRQPVARAVDGRAVLILLNTLRAPRANVTESVRFRRPNDGTNCELLSVDC
jgi:hypothetical protein